jgi:citronellol/citronellal dehydrogenase
MLGSGLDDTMNTTQGSADSLDGKVAIVTGASRGIGAEISRRLAAAGAGVAVSARTVEAGQSAFEGTITETVDSIIDTGGVAVAIAANLASREDRIRLIADTERELGLVDILVNNGAVTYFEPVVDFDERHFQLMFEVQVTAPFHLASMVLPGMRERGSGSILNISSKAGLHPEGPPYDGRQGGVVYGMVKAALERFSTGLAGEVHADGITVNVLSPTSIVATPGVVHHKLITPGREAFVEPVEVMAEAAFSLISGNITGKIAYSQQHLWEVGLREKPAPDVVVSAHPRSPRRTRA